MDPLAALALAEAAIKIADGLLNAYVSTRGAMAEADIHVGAARMAALKAANDDLSARVHAELQAIISKAS
jgi:hypothetical protein